MILAITAAFVAGSIATGTMTFAGDDGGSVAAHSHFELQSQIDDLDVQVDLIELIPGPQGPEGDDGLPGADGVDGLPGADGQDGAPGADGQDGAPGDDGQDGAPGADGDPFSNYYLVETRDTGFFTVSCDTGDIATGGGVQSTTTTNPIVLNRPIGNPATGWQGQSQSSTVDIIVLVICADIAAPFR